MIYITITFVWACQSIWHLFQRNMCYTEATWWWTTPFFFFVGTMYKYVIQSSAPFLWKNITQTVKTKQIDNGAVCLNFEPFLLLLLSWETLILIAHSIGNEKVTTTYAASCIIGEREMGVLGISFSLLPYTDDEQKLTFQVSPCSTNQSNGSNLRLRFQRMNLITRLTTTSLEIKI